VGLEPPALMSYYSIMEEKGARHVEVKWVKKISEGIYRIGLKYIKIN